MFITPKQLKVIGKIKRKVSLQVRLELHGFASIPTSQSRDDVLVLHNSYITTTVRCAPPQNKPTKQEMENCFEYLDIELQILKNISVILCLGKIAYDTTSKLLGMKSEKFGHNKMILHGKYKIITSYHPSKQNTQTGRLTWKEWSKVFDNAKKSIHNT